MSNDAGTADRIRAEIEHHDIVLFMNGTPVFPQCGPSSQVVQILGLLGVQYKSIDVMADPHMLHVLKNFSNWPSMPQLFVRGAFVGDNNIVRELFESGELQRVLAET